MAQNKHTGNDLLGNRKQYPCSNFVTDVNKVKLTMFFFFLTSHGIRCAGIISAVANNSFCGVGIAYSAKIGGKCGLSSLATY